MGLTLGQRKAVTKVIATRYRRAGKAQKSVILDELCATTGWHRNHARKALAAALRPRVVPPPRRPRTPTYGPEVVAALRLCWAVLGAPTGKRLAAVLPTLVPTLRRFGELPIRDEIAEQLVAMSPATIDRRLAADRAAMRLKGRSLTKPGSLLKSQIPIRTWAQWDDAVPGFVEIDLVGHEGGDAAGEHAYTLTVTVTDIATGWTENRSVPNKARRWVLEALEDVATVLPFPLLGVDSDNGSEFINHQVLTWCRTILRSESRSGRLARSTQPGTEFTSRGKGRRHENREVTRRCGVAAPPRRPARPALALPGVRSHATSVARGVRRVLRYGDRRRDRRQ